MNLRCELIGLVVEVVEAKNKALVGIKGKVVDETRNMVVVGDKKLVKDQVVFDVHYDGKKVRVEGRRLVGRPEERLKKVKK